MKFKKELFDFRGSRMRGKVNPFGELRDEQLELWLTKVLEETEREKVKELEKAWYEAIDRWYCEHCGKFISNNQQRALRKKLGITLQELNSKDK